MSIQLINHYYTEVDRLIQFGGKTIRDQAKQLRAEAAAWLEKAKQEVEAMILGKDNNQ